MEARLRKVRATGRKLLVPYLTGGLGAWTEMVRAVADAGADAVLAATVFHFGTIRIPEVKQALRAAGHPVR